MICANFVCFPDVNDNEFWINKTHIIAITQIPESENYTVIVRDMPYHMIEITPMMKMSLIDTLNGF
jgi:hypothetical protein